MPVGKTKDVGWQIGVSRALPCTVEEAWALVTSGAGMALWLGEGAVLKPVPGAAHMTADGTAGEVCSFRPYDRIRLTWRPRGWPHDSTVQVALSGGPRSTTVRFHQERLASTTERERQRDHWRAVLDQLEDLLGQSPPRRGDAPGRRVDHADKAGDPRAEGARRGTTTPDQQQQRNPRVVAVSYGQQYGDDYG